MNIVLNKCYGGFQLSDKAIKWLEENKGWKLDKEFVKLEHSWGLDDMWFMATADKDELRIDLDVIECVETLKEESHTRLSDLCVVEIPDNANWEIDEYDGIENVREKSEVWG